MPVTRSTSGREESRIPEIHNQAVEIVSPGTVDASSPPGTESDTTTSATISGTTSGTTASGTTTTTTTTGTEEEKLKTVREKSKPSKSGKTIRSTKQLRITQAREEIARAELEAAQAKARLARATLERLTHEEDEDDDQDLHSVSDRTSMVRDWVEKSAQIPAEELKPIAEPPIQSSTPVVATTVAATPIVAAAPIAAAPIVTTPIVAAPIIKAPAPASIDLTALAAAIAEASRRSPRYHTELPPFDGACSEWLHFRAAFRDSEKHFSKTENVARMRKSLRGEAKEAASGLFLAEADPHEIVALLEARFGRPDALLMLEIEKVKMLPKVSDSAHDLSVFASKVNNVVATIRALKKDYYMYNPDVVRGIVEKLNPALRYRWYDYASSKPEEEPDLSKMAQFLLREANQSNRYAPSEVKIEKTTPPLRTQRREQRVHTQTDTSIEKQTKCPLCEGQHSISGCDKMKAATIDNRWNIARQHRACFRCLKHRHQNHRCPYKPCGIEGCKGSHHNLLHHKKQIEEKEVVMSAQRTGTARAYLKIVPVSLSGPTSCFDTYALLDEGSTITLVDSEIAKAVGAHGPIQPLNIEGVAGTHVEADQSSRVELHIKGHHHNKKHRMTAHTIDRLCLSPQSVYKSSIIRCRHLADVIDDLTFERATPSVIIGQDNWHLIVSQAIKRGPRGQPVASLTELGWVLHGVDYSSRQQVHFLNRVTAVPNEEKTEIDDVIKRHFELDSIGIVPRRPQSDPEQRALQILEKTCKRLPNGRYEAGLLWKEDERDVPDSRNNALKRLENTEKRLDKDPNLKQAYMKQMQHFIDSGYAEPAEKKPTGTTWYLPHFAVVNPSKPKPRIVHDAAARTRGISLNDLLVAGPDLLQSLPGVLMRFRQLPVAVTADIREMFLQIKIREEDRDALRFLWRGDNRTDPPQEFRMTSVIFGAASSPCTAIYVKNKNAHDHEDIYPEATAAIIRHHYMDDYIQSFDNIEDAAHIAGLVDKVHQKAHFHLRGWTSNEPAAVRSLTQAAHTSSDVKLDKETEKILGLRWRPSNDTLGFNVQIIEKSSTPTKREALRVAMSIFDPLGLITPINIQAKHLLQETWRIGLGWDEPLPPVLESTWRDWLGEIKKLANIEIPRAHSNMARAREIQLHTFADASQTAYAAASYWRIIDAEGHIQVTLAAAKGRVAPLKTTSIPRLELQAALLGARLAEHVIEEHDFKPARRVFWTDSRTVLAWLQNGSRTYKPYVAHRLAAIEELTKINEWRWVPTQHNVADDATRGIPNDFNEKHRWYNGPMYLYSDETEWPSVKTHHPEKATGEERVTTTIGRNEPKYIEALPNVDRFSSWLKLIRATARVIQFIERCRNKQVCATTRRKRTTKIDKFDKNWKAGNDKKSSTQSKKIETSIRSSLVPLEGDHIAAAETLWIRAQQQQSFPTEKRALTGGSAVQRDSRLRQLSLIIDKDEIIRIRTRIAATEDITQEQRAPAVMDGHHPYARLYIDWVHKRLHHGGIEAVTNEVLQRFWILRLRPIVRGVVKSCIPCRRRRAAPPEPPTGDLPKARTAHHERPFTYTGLDYFGPVSVSIGRRHEKRYVALFTCLTSRAVHLEIAASLSTDSAIMALRRMMARRGCPKEIWSDNGTNLRGADVELRRAASEAVKEAAANYTIRWRYIPPGAPFMGGAWERMVRSVKTALQTTLQERHPPEEVLHTLLLEAEHTVNSRPLTHVSVNPGDLTALTPNDLLLGGPSRVPVPGAFVEGDTIGRKYWRHAQHLAEQFWRRWTLFLTLI